MELFFSIFEGLILAAGPFGVFARMALPSDTGRTGNLLFRGFTSSDNSVDIIDGPINITFSSAGGGSSNVKIQNFEIAFGSGDGLSLTSSYGIFVPGSCVVTTTNRTAIVNIDQWMGSSPVYSYDRKTMVFNTYGSGTSTDSGKKYGNLIIGGKYHKICSYPNYTSGYMVRNTILGGCRNCLIQDTGSNIELSSPVFSTKDNLITASKLSCMTHGTKGSTIISSNRISMVRSHGSSVISSKFSNMGLQSTGYVANNNTIIASNYNMIGYDYAYGYGYKTNAVENNILSGRDNCIKGIYNLYSISEANINKFNLILGKQNTIYGVRKNAPWYTGWGSQYNFISGGFNFINGKRNSIFSSRSSGILDYASPSQNTNNTQKDNVIISSLVSRMKNCSNNSYPYSYGLFMNSIISSDNVFQRNYDYYSSYKNSIISSFSGAQYGYCNTMISSVGITMFNSKNSVIMSSESLGSFLDFKMCSANCSVLISSKQSKVNSPNSAVISSATSSVYGSKGRPIVVISSADSCIRSGESSTILSSAKSNICLAFGSTIISSRNSNICSELFTGGLTASSIIGSHCSGVSESLGNTIVASCFGCIVFSPNSSILGGTCNCIQYGNSSTIIGGRCNRICCSNYSSIIGGNSMFLTQSNTTAVQNIFVKSCIFVGRTLTGFTGYAVNGVNALSICRGIVTCII